MLLGNNNFNRGLICLFLSFCVQIHVLAQSEIGNGLKVRFVDTPMAFSDSQKTIMLKTISETERKIRHLLPTLPGNISVFIQISSRNFDLSGGINGRAERNSPAEVILEISDVFPGGVNSAIETALSSVIYHEFHHLSKGWAIKDNKHDIKIQNATIFEGLAVVFAETYSGVSLPWNEYPKEVEQWVKEIIALPGDSNYNQWMFQHSDGRLGIGYKTGNFIIRTAMKNSGMDILELSRLSPRKIYKLAGYKL